MEKSFFQDAQNLSTVEALYEAQKIAFAPIVFQVARVLRDTNILNILIHFLLNIRSHYKKQGYPLLINFFSLQSRHWSYRSEYICYTEAIPDY